MLKRLTCGAALAVGALALAGCSPKNVSYSRDVKPILERSCYECHAPGGRGFQASGFDVTSYEALMKGGKFGPLIKPGDAFTSAFNMLVEGRVHSSIRMPHGREKLSEYELEVLKVWVSEGAQKN
jgi:hypothetical protein